MPSITLPGAVAAGGLGSLAGGAISAAGAESAAKTQAAATQAGITTQLNEFSNIAGLQTPFINTGVTGASELENNVPNLYNNVMSTVSNAQNQLQGVLPGLTKTFNPTMQQLESTPGYQFTLNQGLQGVANAYSGQGLGAGVTQGATAMTPSGPGAKGAINYAEGLASSTYQQQFQNYLSQNAQLYNIYSGAENQMVNQSLAGATTGYNMSAGQAQLGENAVAALGGVSQNSANSIAGLQSAGGAALAAGTQSAANAIGQSVSGATSGLSNFALLNSLGGGNLFAGTPFTGVTGGAGDLSVPTV